MNLSEVIVVDDGSSDGSKELLRASFPAVRCLIGDGTLLWTGAIVEGMKEALREGAEFIFWLNHDCRPDAGSFERLSETAVGQSAACVSAWCHISDFPACPVNPGFRSFSPIPTDELEAGHPVHVDALNGNFVCFRAEAIRRVGLPDAQKFPHYGDGPYTIRFSRAGLPVLVDPRAGAALGYEVERRMSPFWRVAISSKPVKEWVAYYFANFRSLFHWRYRWNETVAFRGWLAPLVYGKNEVFVFFQILQASLWRLVASVEARRRACIAAHERHWPRAKLEQELAAVK